MCERRPLEARSENAHPSRTTDLARRRTDGPFRLDELGFTADYGAYEGGPLAYFGGGSLLFWPVVVLVGALTGGVPYRFGERRAALVAGVAMTIFAVVGIGVGSVLGTRARAAQLPTSPVCVATRLRRRRRLSRSTNWRTRWPKSTTRSASTR